MRGPSRRPTKRSRCIALKAEGLTHAVIAERMQLSERQVEQHLCIARRLGETTLIGRADGRDISRKAGGAST